MLSTSAFISGAFRYRYSFPNAYAYPNAPPRRPLTLSDPAATAARPRRAGRGAHVVDVRQGFMPQRVHQNLRPNPASARAGPPPPPPLEIHRDRVTPTPAHVRRARVQDSRGCKVQGSRTLRETASALPRCTLGRNDARTGIHRSISCSAPCCAPAPPRPSARRGTRAWVRGAVVWGGAGFSFPWRRGGGRRRRPRSRRRGRARAPYGCSRGLRSAGGPGVPCIALRPSTQPARRLARVGARARGQAAGGRGLRGGGGGLAFEGVSD